MTTTFRTRKAQLQHDVGPQLVRDIVAATGHPVNPRVRRAINRALRCAAMVGAAEERHRTLDILRTSALIQTPLAHAIVKDSVLQVLGYARQAPLAGPQTASAPASATNGG